MKPSLEHEGIYIYISPPFKCSMFQTYKILKPLQGGNENATGVRQLQARIPGGKAVQKRKPNMHSSCPTSASRHMCSNADKEDEDGHVM